MNVYKIGEFARLVGANVKTLQGLDRAGILVAGRTITGRRYYTDEDIKKYLHLYL